MKVHSNFARQTSKHRLLALSCVTALAGFAFISKPVLAEEATVDRSANVETTADLVETKVVDATPATEATANTSEEAATVNTDSTTNLTTVTVSQEQTPDQPAVTTNAVEPQTTNTESNTTTGHYYSDDQGNWYYKDANGENLKGAQTIDGQNVYFRDNGQQVKGGLAKSNGFLDRYYDVDSGDLWTNRYVEFNGTTLAMTENLLQGHKPLTVKKFTSIVIMVSKLRVTLQATTQKRLPMVTTTMDKLGTKLLTKVLFNVKTATGSTSMTRVTR